MENKLGAAEFKATCLSVLEEVANSRRPVTITKRGKPIARLVPVDAPRSAANPLDGSLLWEKDIVGPFHEEWDEEWNAAGR